MLVQGPMNSAAIVALCIVSLAAAASAGCTAGSAGAVGELADAGAKDAQGQPADAKVSDATSTSADATAADAPGSNDAPVDAYSGQCTFSADAYDLSCATNTDCVAAYAGYYCSPAQCGCDPIGISKSALAKFNADVAKTPLGSGAVEGVDCGCPLELGPCCVRGTCQANAGCFAPPADM
jgi:hypothetical protein